jgi:hypothetical protein
VQRAASVGTAIRVAEGELQRHKGERQSVLDHRGSLARHGAERPPPGTRL